MLVLYAPALRAGERDMPMVEGEAIAAVNEGILLAPRAFRAAAQRCLPSIVRIETLGGVDRPVGGGLVRQGMGPTTGLVLASDGWIVTSTFNFLDRPPIITVILQDGTRHVARLAGSDPSRKICLLKIDAATDLPVPALADSDGLKVGQWAVSVGVGYGDEQPALSSGIISATGRIGGRAVQTDANISPANYGGPLLDIEGQVIGICVPIEPKSSEVDSGVGWYDSGIGFAIPLDDLTSILDRMKKGDEIKPARLGIVPQPADPDQIGVIVTQVQENSAADKAGLQKGDRITAIDEVPLATVAELRRVLSRHVAGDSIKLTVQREKKTITLTAKLKEAAEEKPEPPDKPPTRKSPGKKEPPKK